MFLVVSRTLVLSTHFFARPKNQAPRKKFVHPCSTNKDILVKVEYQKKDATAVVNKELMNKRGSKNVFLRFYIYTLQHLLVATYRGVFRTGAFLQKQLTAFSC